MRAVWLLAVVAACGTPPDAGPDPDGPAVPDAPSPDGPGEPLGDPFAALRAMPGTCSADGWCFRWPTPAVNTIRDVYGSGPDNIWIVGQQHTVWQWDGHTWKQHLPPILPGDAPWQNAFFIAGIKRDDMWLHYGHALVQWNGATWRVRDSLPASGNPAYRGVWAAPNGEIWAPMTNGIVRRWRPGAETFDVLDTGCNCFLNGAWGTAADDVYISTVPAGILHYDGHDFRYIHNGPEAFGGFVGFRNDVWGVGSAGNFMHWDGTQITTMPSGLTGPNLTIGVIDAIASDDIYWIANGKRLLHWDGTAIKVVPYTFDGDVEPRGGRIIAGEWWLLGDRGRVFRKAAQGAVHFELVAPLVPEFFTSNQVKALWGTADDNMYLADLVETRHWDGTTMKVIGPASFALSGTRTNGVDEVFGLGWRYDGTSVTTYDLPGLRAVWALGPGEAIAVGNGGLALHYTQGAWVPIATGTTATLRGVWGRDADHAMITGDGGTLLVWDRARPTIATRDATLSTSVDLGPISGTATSTWIYGVGSPTLLHTTPAGWEKLHLLGADGPLFAGADDDVVLATVSSTRIIRWNGWSVVLEDSNYELGNVAAFKVPGGSWWVAGRSGEILTRQ
ncbi:MAG: hypothetical protein KIT31_31500 [Deltaproteobacteria bacterium]|nr:hypothetical protein [Deltaproteobacteria bacterium]